MKSEAGKELPHISPYCAPQHGFKAPTSFLWAPFFPCIATVWVPAAISQNSAPFMEDTYSLLIEEAEKR